MSKVKIGRCEISELILIICSILLSIGLPILLTGIFFTVLHWPGGIIMLETGIAITMIMLLLANLNSNKTIDD